MAQAPDGPTLGELLADLAQQTGTLVRQEAELARAELGQVAARAGREVAALAVGGAVVYAGFLAILAGIVLALGEAGLPWWLAALLVGAVVAGGGLVLVGRARAALARLELAPRRTAETLKEDRAWAQEQVK